MSRRKLLVGTAGVVGVSVLAACTPQVATPSGTSKPGRVGGQLVFASNTDPSTMNPNVGTTSAGNSYYSPVVFDALVRPAEDYSPLPSLAESWDISPDGKAYTFKLRKGVKFHDGAPFTSADVKYSWDLVNQKSNTGVGKNNFLAVKGAAEVQAGTATEVSGITTPDEYTVRAELIRADAPFLPVVGGIYILPKHIYGKVPVTDLEKHPTARAPVGTGPFKFVEWRSQEAFVTEAFADYWGGRPKLDRFVMRIVPDLTTLPSLIKSGAVDAFGLFNALQPTDYDAFKSDSKFQLYEMPGYTAWVVYFMMTDPILQDPKVRQALIAATDRDSLLKNVMLGHGKIADGKTHPTSWAYVEPSVRPKFDAEKAKSLLREAGYSQGADGFFAKGGQRLSVTLSTFMSSTTYPEVIQEQWRKVGIELKIDRTDFAAFFGPKWLARKFQIGGSHTAVGIFADPWAAFSSRFISARASNNFKEPAVEDLLLRANATVDRAERKKLYSQATDAIARQDSELQLAMPDEIWVSTSKVRLVTKGMSVLAMQYVKDWERLE